MSRLLVFWLIGVAMAATWAEEPEDSTSLVSPLLRATLAVADIDESLTLYRDVLGLTVWRDMEMSGERLNKIVGSQNETARIVILRALDQEFGHIALFEYVGSKEKAPKQASHGNQRFDVGEVALVMNTTDIEKIHQEVKSRGLTIISPPSVLFPRPQWQSETYEMMFMSPDGVAINVIQRGIP